MLVYHSKLIGQPVLSVQAGGPIGYIATSIVEPDTLKIIAFILDGPLLKKSNASILDVSSIREYSHHGFVIDDIDELVEKDDVIKIAKIMDKNTEEIKGGVLAEDLLSDAGNGYSKTWDINGENVTLEVEKIS